MTSATFPEAWPEQLKELAPRTTEVPLEPPDAWVLGSFTPSFRAAHGPINPPFFSDSLLAQLDAALADFEHGVMPRISYCSWKVSTLRHFPTRTLKQMLALLTQPDPRVAAALEVMVTSGDPVVLHLRDWRDLAPWSEFRMFIKDRQFAGVSQYHHREHFPLLARNYAPLAQVLADFADRVLEVIHMDDVVVDLAVAETAAGGFQAELIELNPFDRRTDPCLFSWDKPGDFDQTFRIRLPAPSTL